MKPHKHPEGYKKLLVYQKAAELQEFNLQLTDLFPRAFGWLKEQMDKSGRSGTKNIIEGWKRNTTQEYYTFLGYSIAAIEELKDDSFDIAKGLYKPLMGIAGLWENGDKGVKGNKGTDSIPLAPSTPPAPPVSPSPSAPPISSAPPIKKNGNNGVNGNKGTGSASPFPPSPSSPSSPPSPPSPPISSILPTPSIPPIKKNGSKGTGSSPPSPPFHPVIPLTPFPPLRPLDLEQLRFYPLDPALPLMVQLYLRSKEVLMLLFKLQQSLEQKMNQEGTMSQRDKLLALQQQRKEEDEWLKNLMRNNPDAAAQAGTGKDDKPQSHL